jgi:hypothetical protein
LPQIKEEFESFSLMSIWEQNVRVLKDNFFYKIKILEFIFSGGTRKYNLGGP